MVSCSGAILNFQRPLRLAQVSSIAFLWEGNIYLRRKKRRSQGTYGEDTQGRVRQMKWQSPTESEMWSECTLRHLYAEPSDDRSPQQMLHASGLVAQGLELLLVGNTSICLSC